MTAEELRQALAENPFASSRELAERLGVAPSTVRAMLLRHPELKEYREARRAALREFAEQRSLELVEDAYDVIELRVKIEKKLHERFWKLIEATEKSPSPEGARLLVEAAKALPRPVASEGVVARAFEIKRSEEQSIDPALALLLAGQFGEEKKDEGSPASP